jgi:NADH:ubiquinone oxidoreductase subunit F (NADH-binding)
MSGTATMPGPRPAGPGSPAGLPRLLPDIRQDLAAHLREHGPLPYRGAALIEEIRRAGLTGRGGAGFPTAVKMTAVAGGRGRPVVVGNGAEGEPASDKDKYLLAWAPHLVLDGLQLAADAVGARQACLYLHTGGGPRQAVTAALAERAATGWDRLAVAPVDAPPRFLAGEESALASRVGGGPARPTFKRRGVYERGVGGAPTLVQNVETLAHIALIARFGADWFRAVGTADEPGSLLVTVHRADGVSLVSEVPAGALAGGVLDLDRAPAQAVLTGGYHGAWLPAARVARLPLTAAALRGAGGALGAGVLAALPADRCGLAETARVLRYLAAESAGQCGPCLNGLPRIAAAFGHLAGPRPDHRCLADLERWSGLVAGRGACHHPDGTVRLVRSALTVFAAEIDRHGQGRCAAEPGPGSRGPAPFLPLPKWAPNGTGPGGGLSREDWR